MAVKFAHAFGAETVLFTTSQGKVADGKRLGADDRSLNGSLIGGIRETQEMLDFCVERGIVCDIELIPIQQINEAYERMLKSDVKYRFVIDMASLTT